jgi:hypothetical protein
LKVLSEIGVENYKIIIAFRNPKAFGNRKDLFSSGKRHEETRSIDLGSLIEEA